MIAKITRLSSGQVRKFTGVTRRQLEHWIKTGMIDPPQGLEGIKHCRYGPRDLIVIKAAKIMRDQGLSTQRCRAPIEKLRKNMRWLRDESLLTCAIVPSAHGVAILGSNDSIWPVYGGANVIMVRKFCMEIREFAESDGGSIPE